MINKQKTVYVGMSGGVDSSVSAALLKQATPNNFEKLFGRPTPKGFRGYNVVGVFIKAWEPVGYDCGWREERRDAMRAAAHLDIPFITLDLSKEYKESVVDYMVAEYKVGRTPNPDVMCNKTIKFGAFLKRARAMGADYIATGHYARAVVIPAKAGIQTRCEMLAGVDNNKDQSYFLWTLNQNHLAHTLFPIGHLEKPEVRKLATKFGLPNQAKKDSQGLCFIGKLDIKDFLREFITVKAGDVLDLKGHIIGQHTGVLFYTLGERHGFEIFKKTPNEKPLYVVAKDLPNNTLTVSDMPFIGTSIDNKEIIIESINWTSGQTPDLTKKYQARIRYRQPLQFCHLEQCKGDTCRVVFVEPQASVASGQSLVLYADEVCLGGGVIR